MNTKTEKYKIGKSITVTDGDIYAKHYPLVLMWKNDKVGREWKLSFMSKPENRITIEGDKPTRAEMAEVILQTPNINDALLDLFMMFAESAKNKSLI